MNDDEYKLYNEIKQLTPYMVERLYGVNISSLLLDRISKTGRLNKSMTPIYKVMQVQNVIGREIIVELYLKGDWDEYTTGKHITYESKWLYPLVMYHVQRLKQDFIKEYYDDENVFYTELLSAIVGALETNRFRLKFFNFDNKKIKKDDIEDVEDFYRNIWKIYYNGNLEKLFDVDFSVPVSINAIKTIIDDFVYNQQTRKI